VSRAARWILSVPAISLAGFAAGLAGCTGSLFRSSAVPPTIYVLSPVAAMPAAAPRAAPSAAVIPADLAVLKPRLPPGLDNDRIAALYPDRHLDYFAGARWSGPLADVLADLAEREFRVHGNLRSVSGDASSFPSGYWMEIEATDFQAEYAAASDAPTVRVRLLARIGTSGKRRLSAQFSASAEQTAAQNRMTAIVDAYARAADAALADLVAQADDILARASAAE
jgi:ABC-type uncharacterized transport system auxiliary subunit